MTTSASPMSWTNWGRNQSVFPRRVEKVTSARDVAGVITDAIRRGQRVKAVRSGHSFSAIAVPSDVQITLDASGTLVDIDAETGLAEVPAGLELHRLNRLLWQSGLSMQNLGDIEAQTVAGAISTGTHGTGARKQGLASQVRALEMVLGGGDIVTCSPESNPDLFSAARVVETEYAIPREAIQEALSRVRRLTETYAYDVTFPLEVRFAAADDVPLSTAFGRDTAYIAAHVYRGQPHQAYFEAFEAVMNDYGGRPHWGKMHNLTASRLRSRYPLFDQFLAVRDKADPAGIFRNHYLDRVLGLPASGGLPPSQD